MNKMINCSFAEMRWPFNDNDNIQDDPSDEGLVWGLKPMRAGCVPLGPVKHLNHGYHMWVISDGRPAGLWGRRV